MDHRKATLALAFVQDFVKKTTAASGVIAVYSFAIIMWEMLTWKQPYEDMMSAQVGTWGHGSWRCLHKSVDVLPFCTEVSAQ